MNEHTRTFDGSCTTYPPAPLRSMVRPSEAQHSFRPLFDPSSLGSSAKDGRGTLNARVALSPRLVFARLDSAQKNTEDLCRPSSARYAPWPRRDRRRSSKVIASPIPGHLSSYPIASSFFMQVTKSIPSHDHIPHRLWRSSGICAFKLVLI
jgi:hypothetical protein